jgi:hypothetical protein
MQSRAKARQTAWHRWPAHRIVIAPAPESGSPGSHREPSMNGIIHRSGPFKAADFTAKKKICIHKLSVRESFALIEHLVST